MLEALTLRIKIASVAEQPIMDWDSSALMLFPIRVDRTTCKFLCKVLELSIRSKVSNISKWPLIR